MKKLHSTLSIRIFTFDLYTFVCATSCTTYSTFLKNLLQFRYRFSDFVAAVTRQLLLNYPKWRNIAALHRWNLHEQCRRNLSNFLDRRKCFEKIIFSHQENPPIIVTIPRARTAALLSLSIAECGAFISFKAQTDLLFIPSFAKFFNFLRLHSTPPPYVFNVRVSIRNVLLVFPALVFPYPSRPVQDSVRILPEGCSTQGSLNAKGSGESNGIKYLHFVTTY